MWLKGTDGVEAMLHWTFLIRFKVWRIAAVLVQLTSAVDMTSNFKRVCWMILCLEPPTQMLHSVAGARTYIFSRRWPHGKNNSYRSLRLTQHGHGRLPPAEAARDTFLGPAPKCAANDDWK